MLWVRQGVPSLLRELHGTLQRQGSTEADEATGRPHALGSLTPAATVSFPTAESPDSARELA